MVEYEVTKVVQKEFKLVRAICRKERDQPWDLKPKKVVLIGAGAIENSWRPLLSALKNSPPVKLSDKQHREYYEEPEFAAHALANSTFMYRALRNALVRKTNSSSLGMNFFNNSKVMIESFCNFRSQVAASYKTSQASKEISLRKQFENVTSFITDDTVAVITTNWDELLWSETSKIKNLVQLHGRVSLPESMILPTELTTDDEVFRLFDAKTAVNEWIKSGFGQKNDLEDFTEKLSRGEMLTHLDQAHHTAIHWLSSAEELLVWGLNFNIYDAELNSVVTASYDPASPLRKLSVIDINKAQAILAARMNWFPAENVKFINAAGKRFWLL